MHGLNEQKLKELLANKQYKELRNQLIETEPYDIAQLMASDIPDDKALLVFRLLPKNIAVDVFDYLDGTQQNRVVESFNTGAAKAFLEEMPPDDRAELLDEVPAIVARRLLQVLSPEHKRITLNLLGYKEGSAGRDMTPSFVDLKANMTVKAALSRIRKLAIDRETVYQCYVIDSERHLIGTISLEKLVLSEPGTKISDIMESKPAFVYTYADREEAARSLQDRDLLAIPVVDAEERLVGIITYDDVVDIIEEETTEDIYRFGAVTGTERGYFTSRILSVVKRRVVWLFLLVVINTITGSMIAQQEELLGSVVILAAFIPLLIDTGGNIGSQSATVIIRGLATGEVNPRRATRIIIREIGVGFLLGAVLGVIALFWAYLLGGNFSVGIVVGLTLLGISTMATLTGGALPFIFRLLKRDPALVSAPFITTVMDIFGVGLYFIIANLILTIG